MLKTAKKKSGFSIFTLLLVAMFGIIVGAYMEKNQLIYNKAEVLASPV